mmetsp:Transcript_2268/g.5287  ORF Transcript_2268/g.5287 Transcript_2268/m.5287 type:complete len:240 (+) Transcript_2268:65-784(+)
MASLSVGSRSDDPYFIVKREIDTALASAESTLYDTSTTDGDASARLDLAALDEDLDSIASSIGELRRAVDACAQTPEKFHLTPAQVEGRAAEVADQDVLLAKCRTRLGDVKSAVALRRRAKAEAQAAGDARSSRINPSEDLDDAYASHRVLMQEQDEDLSEIEHAARKVGQMGMHISEELDVQSTLVAEFDAEVDTTQTRMATARRMINKLGKKMGKWQSVVMGVLVFLLVILIMFAFS